MNDKIPWHAYVLLVKPRIIRQHLNQIKATGTLPHTPNLWQLSLGVLRMWHRVVFRPETIGMCSAQPVRGNWRARLFETRPLRFPFLLAARAVHPLDLTGLASTPDDLINHLVGTHHEKGQFIFDLEILRCYPGELERLQRRVRTIIDNDDKSSRWLRDLCVYENYHEELRTAVDRAVAQGIELTEAQQSDADLTFYGYVSWCAAQPETPAQTFKAWRRGQFQLAPQANA